MSPARTPESHTAAANAAVSQVIRDHRDDTGFSLAQLVVTNTGTDGTSRGST